MDDTNRVQAEDLRGYSVDAPYVDDHVTKGGCMPPFAQAVLACHPRFNGQQGPADVKECVKATAALRQCFASNPEWFRHQFLRRIDEGLDEDLNPSPEDIKKESATRYRWWTGMRRN
ncbi:hypothetical protein ACQ4PT_021128 [Festuca glaucescens]